LRPFILSLRLLVMEMGREKRGKGRTGPRRVIDEGGKGRRNGGLSIYLLSGKGKGKRKKSLLEVPKEEGKVSIYYIYSSGRRSWGKRKREGSAGSENEEKNKVPILL